MVRAHALARVVPMLLWLVASAVVWALPAAAEEAAAASSAPPAVLLLGPLPSPPAAAAEGPLAPASELVPELDPLAADPWQSGIVATVGQRSLAWRRAQSDESGRLQLTEAGVYWLATRLELARWTELSLELDGGGAAALYLDGVEQATRSAPAADAAPADATLEASLEVAAGSSLVLARVEVGEPASVRLAAGSDPPADLRWSLDSRHLLTRFAEASKLVAIGPLAVDADGSHIARRVLRPGRGGAPAEPSLDILAPDGRVLAASVGGAGASPLAFSPAAQAATLLLSERGDKDSSLLLFDLPSGALRTAVRDEPDLGLVRWSPDGRQLLLASSRGCAADEPDAEAARRRAALREKLPDYNPRPHLHLVDVASGVRLRLTAPGDWVLDDATFVGAADTVVYARTVPRVERPWFATELRRLDVTTGADTLLATFVAGWENRPKRLAPDPRGRRVAFVGPPDELGQGKAEHNVHAGAIYLLDLEAGSFARITPPGRLSYSDDGLLCWTADGALLATASDGSETRIVRLVEGAAGWTEEILDSGCEVVDAAAASPSGNAVAYVAASRHRPPALRLLDTSTGRSLNVESPNDRVVERWVLAPARDASFSGPGGERIDAWWYPPTGRVQSGDRVPLVLYYYGGATPTLRRFHTTHQVLAGNGYAVLVINPRGAFGYGQGFADSHVRDWGPRSAADVLAGLDAFLAAQPGVDPERVGIYGGSYGGFMTNYLVSTSDRFAAAVSLFGISDLASYWGGGAWGYTYGDASMAGAVPWKDRELFVDHSPLYRADRIRTPLLLLHGEADSNVPVAESEQLYTALQVLNREVELVTFPGEDHGIASSRERKAEVNTMILEWFDRYLKAQPEAWSARWEE